MIEIIEVKETRYNSVDDIPIEVRKVIRNKKYCPVIQNAYKETRDALYIQWKDTSKGPEVWKRRALIFDKNFMNTFICLWKNKVFEKSKNFSKDDLDITKEKELIEEALNEGSIQKEVKQYFLENIPVTDLK